MPLITMEDIERISPVFKGKFGNHLARQLTRIIGIDELAERYARRENLEGPAFIDAFLNDLNLRYEVEGLRHLKDIENEAFITISNHPYGGLDGLILMDLFGHLREDYKVMANQFLTLAKTIKNNLISVVPATKAAKGVAQESLKGLRQAIQHLKEGHPLGLFPAGAVSDFNFKDMRIRDREWQQSVIRLIKKMEVPVVPVRFYDRNSNFFYFLGLLGWKIRSLRLPKEILNKKGKLVRVGIGEIITVKQQQQCSSESFTSMLRESVYNM